MKSQNEFHYEIKAPDRVLWRFTGNKTSMRCGGEWNVNVIQEPSVDGINFVMYGRNNCVPNLIDVYSAFQAAIGDLLNPIAWEIHHHRNSGMHPDLILKFI